METDFRSFFLNDQANHLTYSCSFTLHAPYKMACMIKGGGGAV